MIEVWRSFWGELNTPESFHDKPYEGALNQAGHILIGAVLAVVVCLGWLVAFGEMPHKWAVGLALVGGYLTVIECLRQGWQGADSVVDTAFVAQGVSLPLVTLSETQSGALEVHAVEGLVGIGAAVLSLALYVYPRARRKWQAR